MSQDTITFNGNTLDLSTAGASLESNDHSGHVLIQINDKLTKKIKTDLASKDVEIEEKVENGYLARYPVKRGLNELRDLPCVDRAITYSPFFVVENRLKQNNEGAEEVEIDVKLHQDTVISSELAQKIATAAELGPNSSAPATGEDTARMKVKHTVLGDLARLDDVKAIHEVHPDVPYNYNARKILRNGDLAPAANGVGYEGDGQTVCVADSGFDLGSTELNKVPGAFKDNRRSRVVQLYPLNPYRPRDASDRSGHGTHVCGSVLGDGLLADNTRVQGTAPKASLVVQSLGNGFGNLTVPKNLTDLFLPPYTNHGVRIHTNSWGSNPSPWDQIEYNNRSTDIDSFVETHRDMVILFAAGNDGLQAYTGVEPRRRVGHVMSYAAAKNCITVGASENYCANIDTTYWQLCGGRELSEPVASDRVADSPNGMAAFSSRGPTREGRIKPDVVAPGTCILSTRTSRPEAKNELDRAIIQSPDPHYVYMDGTSMATPLVAGCCTVLREALVRNGTIEPSAALIKALVINGAVELSGQYDPTEAGPSPNEASGWGRVDINRSMIIPIDPGATTDGIKVTSDRSAGFRDESASRALDTDDERSFNIDVGKPGQTLKVTLVWTDTSGANLQNDLDLIVRLPGAGTERHGNQGDNGENYDRVNNVEQIEWKNVPEGSVEVVVRGHEITSEEQTFALVWRLYAT